MTSEIGPLIGLGVDLFIAIIFFKWYKTTNKTAADIKKAPIYKLDESLITKVQESKAGILPYACIEGHVAPVGIHLISKHVPEHTGVVQHILHEEHKSKRINGVWAEVKNVIQDTVQTVPFVLRRWFGAEDNTEILITEAMTASFLSGDLTVTHDAFKPAESSGIVSRGLERLFGEVTMGYHENEKMLLTKTVLLGIGEIAIVDGHLQLSPPQSGAEYVLTKRSKAEIIKTLQSKSWWIRCVFIGTSVIGVWILGNLLYRVYKRRKGAQERQVFRTEVEELRAQVARRHGNEENDVACVVCLVNPREIVLLNCGHICVCADCITELPEPLTCPVCRRDVERYVTTYHP